MFLGETTCDKVNDVFQSTLIVNGYVLDNSWQVVSQVRQFSHNHMFHFQNKE